MLLKGACPASTTLARTLPVLKHNTKGIQTKPATRFGCRLRFTLRSRSTFRFTIGAALTFKGQRLSPVESNSERSPGHPHTPNYLYVYIVIYIPEQGEDESQPCRD